MDIINFEDFIKIEIRIGKILAAERVEGSDKLLKLSVDFGFAAPENSGASLAPEGQEPQDIEEPPAPEPKAIVRKIIAGIGKIYAPEALIGKECPFAYNLAPRMLKGLESQGMIMCPSDSSGPVLLHPDKEVPPGSLIK